MPQLSAEILQKVADNEMETLSLWDVVLNLQDVQLLAELLRKNTSIKDIYLSNLDSAGRKLLLEACETHPILQRLRLGAATTTQSWIGDETIIALGQFVQRNRSVQELDISNVEDNIATLLEALKTNHTLRKLDISKNTARHTHSAEAIKALADLIESTSSLQVLGAGSGMRTAGVVAIATALKHNTRTGLKELVLFNNDCGNTGAIALAKMLETNTTIEDLDLANNNIEDEGGVALANALKVNRTLREITLRGNSMSIRGFEAMADMLKINTTLRDVTFADAKDMLCVQAIADALKINTALQRITLSHVSSDGLEQLAKALHNNPDTALQEIHIQSYTMEPYASAVHIKAFETLLATNYTLCQIKTLGDDLWGPSSTSGTQIKNRLKRNRAIQTCVQLMEASGDLKLGKLQDALNALTTAVPGLLSSPAEVPPYIADVYQMMLATMYAVDGQPGEALFLLEGLIANENTRFSEKALQMIPIMLMAKLTTQPLSATETAACCLWLAYISRDEPQSLEYRYAMVKLQNPNPDMGQIEMPDFTELTGAELLISDDDLYDMGKEALHSLQDQNGPEARLLAALLDVPDYDAMVVGFLFQSPAFLKVLQGRYPNIERCRVLENYLLYPRNTGEGVKIFPIPKLQEIAGFEFNERLVQRFKVAHAAEQRADNANPSFSSILQIAKQQSYTEPTSDRVEEFKHNG